MRPAGGGVGACAGCSLAVGWVECFSYLGIVRHGDWERRIKMICGEEMRRGFGSRRPEGQRKGREGKCGLDGFDVRGAKSIDQEK
jgi:hypothetical protein